MMKWIVLLIIVAVIAFKVINKMKRDKEERQWEESHPPITEEQLHFIKEQIPMLSKGLSLEDFLEVEESLKVNGSTKCYNDYGIFVIYNESKDLYTLCGGGNGFSISTTLHMFFLTDEGRGNRYMHKHYVEGDRFSIWLIPFESDSVEAWLEKKAEVKEQLDQQGEMYVDYMQRMSENCG